jgi:hypothetical protein
LFGGGGEGEGFEFGDVLGHLVYAGAGPVGAPEDFVGDVFDAREIFEELLRGDAADVHVEIFVAADEEEGFGHPEGAAAVGEDDGEVGEVDADVVAEHGLGVDVAGAGEDGGAGVNHDGEVVVLGAFVDFAELGVAVEIGVGRERLVGRVDFYGADAEFGDAIDFGAGVGDGAGVDAAEGDEAEGIDLGEVGDPVVDGGGEADDVGGDVVDEAGAFGVDGVEVFKEELWVVAETFDFFEVGAAAGDEFEWSGFHHFVGHDVDVEVDDLGGGHFLWEEFSIFGLRRRVRGGENSAIKWAMRRLNLGRSGI